MKASISPPPPLCVNWKFRFIVPANAMQNGRDALVASAYGTWNTGDIPFSAARRGRSMGHGRDKRDPPARRCRSMGHGRDKRDPPARPSRRRRREGRACRVRLRNVEHRGHSIQRHAQRAFNGARSRQARPSRATIPEDKREGRACRVRLRNVEHRGHPIQHRAPMPFDGARSRQARPSRATIPEETTGGTRLSRPPTERGTQGAFHSAPRAEGVQWGTVATSATLPRDHPGRQTGGTRLSRPPTERGVRPRNPPGKPHATRLGQKTKPDANTHLAERDWRREGDLNPRYGD